MPAKWKKNKDFFWTKNKLRIIPKLSQSEDGRLVSDLRPAFGTSCALSHLIGDHEDGFGGEW